MMKTKNDTNAKHRQSGNIFFYILVGVALFAALAFTVSRGMHGQTSTTLNKRNIDLAVSDILSQAQEIESAISRLRRKQIPESEICFTSDLFSDDNNDAYASLSSCSDDTYRLYHPNGGGLRFHSIPEDWLDNDHESDTGYGEWMFTNVNGVNGIGESTMSDPDSMELISFLPHLKKEVCKAINDKLGLGSDIPNNAGAFAPQAVNSGFTSTSGQINATELEGEYSGCFENSNTWDSYIFYHVLIER